MINCCTLACLTLMSRCSGVWFWDVSCLAWLGSECGHLVIFDEGSLLGSEHLPRLSVLGFGSLDGNLRRCASFVQTNSEE